MSDKKPVAKRKIRADKYDEKVKFDGTLEQMIAIAVKPVKPKSDKNNDAS